MKVYAIQAAANVKVGRATDVQSRLAGLQTGSPFPLVLVHSVEADDASEVERLAHERLAHRRISGEWFRVTPEEAIAAINAAALQVDAIDYDPETPQQRYEAAGKRPGTPVGTRLNDSALARLDAVRGKTARSAWLLSLIYRELKINEELPALKRKLAGKGNRK